MKNIEIIPLYEIRADGVEIRLGDSSNKVKTALGGSLTALGRIRCTITITSFG